MKLLRLALLFLCAVLASSCASIVTGGSDDILVSSLPPGAYFRTNFGHSGITPQTISVPCDQSLSVQYDLQGHHSASAYVGTRLSYWVVGNVLFGGLIGLIIDAAGNGYVHSADRAHVNLAPLPPAPVATSETTAEESARRESFEQWQFRKETGNQ